MKCVFFPFFKGCSIYFFLFTENLGPSDSDCIGLSENLYFFILGHIEWHVEAYFPDQGLNPCPLQWKVES